jgi:hypothetical protein
LTCPSQQGLLRSSRITAANCGNHRVNDSAASGCRILLRDAEWGYMLPPSDGAGNEQQGLSAARRTPVKLPTDALGFPPNAAKDPVTTPQFGHSMSPEAAVVLMERS